MNALKERLAHALGHRRLRAADLARAIGRTESAVSQWLNGETKSMRGNNLMAVCAFLSCNAQWLASGRGVSGLDHPIGLTATPASFVTETKEHGKMPIRQLLVQVDTVIQNVAPVLQRASREALMQWVIGEATIAEVTATLEAFATASKTMAATTPPAQPEPQAQPGHSHTRRMYDLENKAPPRAPVYSGPEKRKAG